LPFIDFVQNTGTSDGVSRDAAPSPTATLVALAAAGRNPADITLPTQGSEGTDPPAGSHETESQGVLSRIWGGITYAAQKVDQAAGVAGTLVLTGQVFSMDAASGSALLGAAATGAGNGAAVVLDTASGGLVAHKASQQAQAEAIARGDVVSQIGYGFGKVGARAGQAAALLATAGAAAGLVPTAVASSGIVSAVATTATFAAPPLLAGVAISKGLESYDSFQNGNVIDGIASAGDAALAGLFAASTLRAGVQQLSAAAESGAAAGPNRIYSARVLVRSAEESGPFHNFPESFNQQIFNQGTRTVTPNFWRTPKPGLSNDSVMYRLPGSVNGVEGTFEIGVRPSVSGNTEVIMHRFFRPNP